MELLIESSRILKKEQEQEKQVEGTGTTSRKWKNSIWTIIQFAINIKQFLDIAIIGLFRYAFFNGSIFELSFQMGCQDTEGI